MLILNYISIFIGFVVVLAARPKIKANAPIVTTSKPHDLYLLKENDTIPSSLTAWDTIENPGRISLLTIAVEHRTDGGWYIPSLHNKDSIGI